LTFALAIRPEGKTHWYPLAKRIDDTFHSWDSRGVPDGTYRVRLTADDGGDNAPGGQYARERVSDPFVVDNTPPAVAAVEVRPGPERFVVSFEAHDRGGRVAAVEFALEDGPWRAVDPLDGIADSDKESYRLTVDRVPGNAGRYLRVRVTDVSGNVGGTLQAIDAP
jgi:hypothetical protein